MPGGYGNIRPSDGKQFSSDYQPAEKWTEKKALKLGEEMTAWMKAKDENGEDKGNIFFAEFLCIENDYYEDLINYLCGKFTSFLELIKKAHKIQEIKLAKFGIDDRLQPAMTIFCLKNLHGWNDKKQVEHQNQIDPLDLSKLSQPERKKFYELFNKAQSDDVEIIE